MSTIAETLESTGTEKFQSQEERVLSFFNLIYFLHLFTCVYIIWATSPPSPTPSFQAEPDLSSCSPILLKCKLKR
jgi:hypothetical protein